MSYIWENYNKNCRFVIDRQCAGLIAEATTVSSDETHVNPFVRFADVFDSKEPSDYPIVPHEIDKDIVNVMFHYLACSDMLYGDVLAGTQLFGIESEICGGAYGERIKNDFLSLSARHKRRIERFLSYYHKSGERSDLFCEVFMSFFGRLDQTILEDGHFDEHYTRHSAEIIYSKSRNTYYCFCAAPQSNYNSALFHLITELFADCTTTIVPIWGRFNFGIVGNDKKQSTAPIVGQTQLI